jgi:hypothetical protein
LEKMFVPFVQDIKRAKHHDSTWALELPLTAAG